ncbi:hypothetical protein GALMADRAFT_254221 [Galerina marginata CBS 339.88]|uniref:mRNA 3'-end-processing protein RNA14 n=1 Tax=Galerina marginata (strain CBS 339.88) TaxID=685588 RepID=A0A067SJD5_GALM3|nr:hypothetical protein GALMADRAFT_254221 [Galerina marginata CBS 339.88]
MSTSEFAAANDDTYLDDTGDQTQPTSEILSALSVNSPVVNEPEHEPQPPQSEYDTLNVQLAENPHNPEGWRRLIHLAEESGNIEKISTAYEALLKQYPNNATAQIHYITHFTNEQATDKVEELFKKFLVRSPCVELWAFYLTYVRRLNSGPSQRDPIRMSYEFALNHVGQDKDSGQLWNDYIQFLQAGEAATTWDQQQKMDSLRKIYHRAVQIPLDNVERLWQELETFETGLNRITAKKFMADLSPAHMQARTVLRQLINHIASLYPPSSPEIYLPSLPRFDASERALVGKWKAYLKWEESNPLELDEKDKGTLITRIQGVYRKAVIRMRYYTEIWFMAYTWTNSVGKHDEATSIIKAGLEANPSSFLLTFAYAEALEIKKDIAEVHATYEKFLGILRTNLENLERTTGSANSSFSSNGSQPIVNNNGNGNGAVGASAAADVGSSFNSQSSEERRATMPTELQKHRTEYGLAWIMYMRFGMRAEGVKGSRSIFGKARRDRWAPWEIYEAAALMEYHCSNDNGIASRIFEKGMDSFGDEIEYVVRYLGFLISINDQNNARALFERVIPTFPPERARPLWERWARYEYQYGDLEAALKLEKRMAEVYTSDPPIKRLAQRHMYLGTDAIAERDLGFANARRGTTASSNSLGRTETSQSLLTGSQTTNTTPSHGKRPPSPGDHRKREDGRGGDYAAGHKRARPSSPVRGPDRERERDGRWGDSREGPSSSRRRFSPPPAPAWERDGSRGREPPPAPRGQDRDEDSKRQVQVTLPQVVSYFIGELPTPATFDGPVFRTDDLMNLFRNAVIPSASSRPKSPLPAPPRSSVGGRPPPDYGPYQGPTGNRGRRY